MTAHVPGISVSLDPQASAARRRKRKRNIIAAVMFAAVAAVLLGLRGSHHPGGAPTGLVGKVSRWHGASLRVTYPRGWHVTTRPLTSITQPVQRFAIYSGQRPQPMAAPEANQVIGVVMEQTALARGDLKQFPQRPTYFAVSPALSVEGFRGSWGEITFRDHHRAFYLFVGVGTHAQSQLSKLLAALDTLRIGR